MTPIGTATVSSSDGTSIAYRIHGHGPGVVVVHGAMESASSHRHLAEALSDRMRVCLYDRRGRGLSGPYGDDYSITRDVDDLDAILSATGAHCVVGVSSGALIALQAALRLPAIERTVIFEPPLSIEGSAPTAWLTRLDAELADGDRAAALVTGMLGAQMGPPFLQRMPRSLLKLMTRLTMSRGDHQGVAAELPARDLAPTLHYDGQIVLEMAESIESYNSITSDALLLGGSASPPYVKTALDALEKTIPGVTRIELPGVGHGATGNTHRGGKPELVASEIHHFLGLDRS